MGVRQQEGINTNNNAKGSVVEARTEGPVARKERNLSFSLAPDRCGPPGVLQGNPAGCEPRQTRPRRRRRPKLPLASAAFAQKHTLAVTLAIVGPRVLHLLAHSAFQAHSCAWDTVVYWCSSRARASGAIWSIAGHYLYRPNMTVLKPIAGPATLGRVATQHVVASALRNREGVAAPFGN